MEHSQEDLKKDIDELENRLSSQIYQDDKEKQAIQVLLHQKERQMMNLELTMVFKLLSGLLEKMKKLEMAKDPQLEMSEVMSGPQPLKAQEQLCNLLKIPILTIKEKYDEAVLASLAPFLPKSIQWNGMNNFIRLCPGTEWKLFNDSSTIHVISGTLSECEKSLNRLESKGHSMDYIFESFTDQNLKSQLNQLEAQLQYMVARHWKRQDKVFPPESVSSMSNGFKRKTAYANCIVKEIGHLVALCGLTSDLPYSKELNKTLVKLIHVDGGYVRPCLWQLLKEKRLLYIPS
jgi:hypothetical protein